MPNVNEYLAQLVAAAKEQQSALEQFVIERQREAERLRGVKSMRYGPVEVTGANPLLIAGDQNQAGGLITPDQGYVWSVMMMVIEGMTRGATPDVIQITRGPRIVWELNGNQYAQQFGKGSLILRPGETLGFQSVGTFVSTAKIIIHGTVWQVPAEMEGKLL